MTPDPVSTRDRVARSERPSTGSRTLAACLAATALLLPAANLRAQAPGTLDPNFVTGTIGATVYAVDYMMDTDTTVKITIGGDRTLGEYLTTEGAGRTDFLFPEFGGAARLIYTIVPEQKIADGNFIPNLLLGGDFGRSSAQTPAQNIVRIMPSGALDTTFATNLGTGANTFVTAILPLTDGRIVVGGQFTTFNRETRRRIVRLQQTGSIDESFATGSNIDNDVITLAESIDPATGQVDGSTLVGGIFNNVAGQPYGKLARLDANGNLDMSFHPSIDLRVLSILVQPTGKIIIGGDFTKVNGVAVNHIARLKYDGSLDTTFGASVTGVPNRDVNPTAVYVLKPLSDGRLDGRVDGRIYVGGEFAQINGTPRIYLGLISADGVLDTSFDPGTAIYDSVQSITPITFQDSNGQPAYRVLIGETLGPKIGKNYQPSLVRLFGVAPGSNAQGTATQQHAQPEVPKKTVHAPASGVPALNAARAAHLYMW